MSIHGTLSLGAFALDPLGHVLSGPRGRVKLSPLGSRLLQALARSPGEVVSRGSLVDELWDGDWLVGDPALTRVVSELRRAVGDAAGAPRLIQTVPRRGYRFVGAGPEVSAAPRDVPPPVRRTLLRFGLIVLAAVIIAGGVFLVIDAAIPLVWLARHGG